jgi:hypothetical protein
MFCQQEARQASTAVPRRGEFRRKGHRRPGQSDLRRCRRDLRYLQRAVWRSSSLAGNAKCNRRCQRKLRRTARRIKIRRPTPRLQLLSADRKYNAVTDGEGRFSISPVPAGEYSFAVKGWGEHRMEVKSSRRGRISRPSLLFSRHKNCLLLTLVSN